MMTNSMNGPLGEGQCSRLGAALLTAADKAGEGSWVHIGKRSGCHTDKWELHPGNKGWID